MGNDSSDQSDGYQDPQPEPPDAVVDQATRGLPRHIRDEIRREAESIIEEEMWRFDPSRGGLRPWIVMILHRRGIDMLRRERTRARHLEHYARTQGERDLIVTPGPTDVEPDQFEELRSVLDRVRWERGPREQIDSYAVFLLNIRLASTSRFSRLFLRPDWSHADSPAEAAETLLQWRPVEIRRTPVVPGLSLGRLWRTIRDELNGRWRCRSSPSMTMRQLTDMPGVVVSALRRHLGTETRANTWSVWVNRSKCRARGHISEDDWNRYFARLFPDHPRVR